jgi:hypothetical protein
MEKDWEARFDPRLGRPSFLKLVPRRPVTVAGAYWIAVVVVFLVLKQIGYDMIGIGAGAIAALTAPWSLLAIAVTTSLSTSGHHVLLRPLISTAGTFLLFPVICGGLNAGTVFLLGSVIQWWRKRPRGQYGDRKRKRRGGTE